MAGNRVTIDGDTVRAMTAAARHDLTDGAPVGQFARAVADGAILLRHPEATAELGTAAARLRQRLDDLRTLVGQVVDAVDASVTTMETTDGVIAAGLDQFALAQTSATGTPSFAGDTQGNG